MSLDGFIAGPGHAMDWVFEYTSPDDFPEIVQATGAMLSGRNCYEVGLRDAGKPSGEAYGGAWHGPSFVLTHRPPAGSSADNLTFLSGDIGAAVATAKAAAADKDLVVLGANVAEPVPGPRAGRRGLRVRAARAPRVRHAAARSQRSQRSQRRRPGRPAAGQQHALRLGHGASI